jgi:hypothetical protein
MLCDGYSFITSGVYKKREDATLRCLKTGMSYHTIFLMSRCFLYAFVLYYIIMLYYEKIAMHTVIIP